MLYCMAMAEIPRGKRMTEPDKQGALDRLLDAYSVMLERANEFIDKAMKPN